LRILAAFVVGICFGSFANVLIYRIPKKISIIKPPSSCTSCTKQLGIVEILPILGWIFLRGKCKHCKEKISIRYPLVECTCGLLFGVTFFISSGISPIFISFFAFILLTTAIIDYDTQEIPDGLIATGAVAAVLWVLSGFWIDSLVPHWSNALLGSAAGALPLLFIDRLCILLVKKDGFGYGDVKLMAVAGLFLGWQNVLVAFFFAFVLGGIYATYLLITKNAEKGAYIAFAPFLCAGSLISVWFW